MMKKHKPAYFGEYQIRRNSHALFDNLNFKSKIKHDTLIVNLQDKLNQFNMYAWNNLDRKIAGFGFLKDRKLYEET
jgi:hypothetical protein